MRVIRFIFLESIVAIPSDPTVNDIVLQGMKEGGICDVTSANPAFAEFKNFQFQSIKSEMWAACKTDTLLETEAVLVTAVGARSVTLPTDFDSEISLTIYDADEPTYRGTAQAAVVNSITLAAGFTATTDELHGRYLFTLGGLGAGQVRQITDYNDTTKVATVSALWTVTPDSTTTYLIATHERTLDRRDYMREVYQKSFPSLYGRTGTGMQVFPAPDKIYPILMIYRSNLTRLDEDGSLFIKHLRERRWLWIQGIKTKTMARFDDDRYTTEKPIWDQALIQYAAENVVYSQMQPNR